MSGEMPMFFALGVNGAQARLDVDRGLFRSNYRQPGQRAGKTDTPRGPAIRNALSHAGWDQLADC